MFWIFAVSRCFCRRTAIKTLSFNGNESNEECRNENIQLIRGVSELHGNDLEHNRFNFYFNFIVCISVK